MSPDRAPLALIVAMSLDRTIGRDGGLPWHLPEDLRRFRRLTLGHAVIMGRRTHESIGRCLPGRRNIVLTRHPERVLEGAEAAPSLEAALALAWETDDEPWVIGGAEVYRAALPLATRIELTELLRTVPGDVFFPPLDEGWVERATEPGDGVVYRSLVRSTDPRPLLSPSA